LGVALEIAFAWAILDFPPLQSFLHTDPVGWQVFALGWLGIPLIFELGYLRKKLISVSSHARSGEQ
jgi:hypothetical protein